MVIILGKRLLKPGNKNQNRAYTVKNDEMSTVSFFKCNAKK